RRREGLRDVQGRPELRHLRRSELGHLDLEEHVRLPPVVPPLSRMGSNSTAGDFGMPARKARSRPRLSASTGAEHTRVSEHRSAAKTKVPAGICGSADSKACGSSAKP